MLGAGTSHPAVSEVEAVRRGDEAGGHADAGEDDGGAQLVARLERLTRSIPRSGAAARWISRLPVTGPAAAG